MKELAKPAVTVPPTIQRPPSMAPVLEALAYHDARAMFPTSNVAVLPKPLGTALRR
jgi:hypothetical protein